MASSRFIADQQLTITDLAAVQNYLAKINHKWIDIGTQLHMDPEYLEKLRKKKTKLLVKDKLRKMLLTWLKGEEPQPTWKALCDALRSAAVDEVGVAERIEKDKLVSEPEVDHGLELRKEPPLDEQECSSSSEESEAEAMTTFPTDTNIQEPFPYLNTSGLSTNERDALYERLIQESEEIRLAFVSLLCETQMSLLCRGIDGSRICDELKSCNIRHHKKIARVVDIGAVIGILKEYLSFNDYYILEQIILRLGTHEDRASLENYKQSLAEFIQRRVFECPVGIFGTSIGRDEDTVTVKRADSKTILYDTTLNQVQIFSTILRKEMDVDDCDMRLIKCKKTEDSLELTFGILSSKAATSFPLSDDKEEKLVNLDVWLVVCGDYTFQLEHDEINTNEADGGEAEQEDVGLKEVIMDDSTTNEPVVLLKNTTTCTDEDIGPHTSICINNKKAVVEVSSSASSTFKAYKVGKCKGDGIVWLSSMKGVRYGVGNTPRIALNDEGFVAEVDEETNGNISYRVGIVHSSNMMIWTENSIFTTGSKPSVALCHRTVVATFKRAEDAFYRIGTLDAEKRNIFWAEQEHRFVNGVSDLAVAVNQVGVVASVYTKQMVTSALSPLYATVGMLNKTEKKIAFSSNRTSSQSLSYGICPSVALSRSNNVMVLSIQQKSGIQKKVKYRLGLVKKAEKNNAFDVVWSSEKGLFDIAGNRASVAMNDRGVVLISHSIKGESFCHVAKVFHETTI